MQKGGMSFPRQEGLWKCRNKWMPVGLTVFKVHNSDSWSGERRRREIMIDSFLLRQYYLLYVCFFETFISCDLT